MSDDEAFLAAIRDAPDDNTPRLVYADWLDEQGRPGGAFLRVDCQIASLDPAECERQEQELKLRQLEGRDSVPSDMFVGYVWQRMHLVAELRCHIRDLDEEWMATVSRVPIDEIMARVWQIQSWLRRRVAVADVQAGTLTWEPPPAPTRSLWQRVRGLLTGSSGPPPGPQFEPDRAWAAEHMRPGDELWEYDTGGGSWAHLSGEMGYAIVRDGKVVEFEMLVMN